LTEHYFKWGSAAGNKFDLTGGNVSYKFMPVVELLECDSGDPALKNAGKRRLKIMVQGAKVSQSELANIKTVTSTAVGVLQASYPVLGIYENLSNVDYLVTPPNFDVTIIPGTGNKMNVDLECYARASSGTGRTLTIGTVTLKYGIRVEQVGQAVNIKTTILTGRDDHHTKFAGEQPQQVTFIGEITDTDLDALQQIYAAGAAVEVAGDVFDTASGGYLTTNRASKAMLTSYKVLDYQGALIQVLVTLQEDTMI